MLFTIIGMILYAIVSSNIFVRVSITSVFYASISLYLFYESSLVKGNTKMQSVIGYIALLFAIANIIRAYSAAVLNIEMPVYQYVPGQVLLGLAWVIISFSFPILFLFLLLEKDNKALVQLNGTKDKFFRIIAHDLKAPISQMIQVSGLLESEYKNLPDEKILQLIKAIKNSSTSGFALLENLLEWAQTQTHDIVFSPETIEIKELVDENLVLLSRNAQHKNVELKNNMIKNSQIFADRNILNAIIRNLISNAIKYSYKGGSIEINFQSYYNDSIISVKDSGKGMTKEELSSLFKIDAGFSTPGTNNEKGTGLGLLICKEFVKKHNGDIWAESAEQKGSHFFIKIPTKQIVD